MIEAELRFIQMGFCQIGSVFSRESPPILTSCDVDPILWRQPNRLQVKEDVSFFCFEGGRARPSANDDPQPWTLDPKSYSPP